MANAGLRFMSSHSVPLCPLACFCDVSGSAHSRVGGISLTPASHQHPLHSASQHLAPGGRWGDEMPPQIPSYVVPLGWHPSSGRGPCVALLSSMLNNNTPTVTAGSAEPCNMWPGPERVPGTAAGNVAQSTLSHGLIRSATWRLALGPHFSALFCSVQKQLINKKTNK